MSHKIDTGPSIARLPEVRDAPVTRRAGGEHSEPVQAAVPSDSIRLTGDAEGLQALERQLGAEPATINGSRVEALRAALADGSYRIDAQQIADRLIALDSALGA